MLVLIVLAVIRFKLTEDETLVPFVSPEISPCLRSKFTYRRWREG